MSISLSHSGTAQGSNNGLLLALTKAIVRLLGTKRTQRITSAHDEDYEGTKT
jgi:hypothetical protein